MFSKYGKYKAIQKAEELWSSKTRDQVLHYVDLCMMRSLNAKSGWARKYWHGVAEDLVEKYAS
jgi:hypothetical protein